MEMLGLFKTRQTDVNIDNIADFLSSEFRNDIDRTARTLGKLEEDILAGFRDLRKSFEELLAIDNANTYTSNLKNRYCKKAFDSISSVTRPGSAYGEKKRFLDSCIGAAGDVSNIDIKEFRHLGMFSVKMSKISSQLAQLNRLCSLYSSSLTGSRMEDVHDAGSSAERIFRLYDALLETENGIKTMENSASFIETKISSHRIDISEAEKELQDLGLRKGEIEEDEKHKNTIETSLSTEFGSIERILRKFAHDCENLIDKDDIDVLKKYMDEPSRAFLVHDDGSVIRRYLIRIREALLNSEFTTDEKTEKVERMLRSMDFYLSMREQYHGIVKVIVRFNKKMEDARKPLLNRKQSAEEDIEKLQLDLAKLRDSIEKKKESNAGTRKLIASGLENLSSIVSKKCSRNISIRHSFAL